MTALHAAARRVAFVTGGSGGIGRAIVAALAAQGLRVAIGYHHNAGEAGRIAAHHDADGENTMVVAHDLTDEASPAAAVDEILQRWGRLDVLVNNAVVWGAGGPGRFEEIPPAGWQTPLRANLDGTYRTIQAAVAPMRAGGWGRIVNVSSSVATDGMAGSGPYAAAKAALHGLSRTLAVELAADGILTNVVQPGLTATDRANDVIPKEIREHVAAQTPTRRLTTPEDVAAVIAFLGSDANGHVNGELIRVTGGL